MTRFNYIILIILFFCSQKKFFMGYN